MKRFAVLLCTAIAAAIACSDSGTGPAEKPGSPVPTSLAKVGGDEQTGTVGSTLAQPLTVRVHDQNGSAMSGVMVTWSVTAGGGSVSSSSTTTGSNGEAVINWTLGTTAGGNLATASVSGVSAEAVFAATGEPDRPANVTVSEDSVSFTAVGDTLDLDAAVEDRFGNTVESTPLTWTTGDSLVAVADSDGRVVSRGEGSAEIQARADTARGIVVIQVEQLPAGVVASPRSDTLNALADTATFSAAVYDGNGNAIAGEAITWATLDESIATVTSSGDAIAGAPGTVLVTASAGAVADTATLLVRQVTAAISVSPSADTLAAGDTLRFAAAASDSNGFDIPEPSFAWVSSDTAVASVDAAGLVQGKVARSATISATNAGVSGAADLTIVPGPAASISMLAGDAQTGPAGEPLPDSLVVQVADAYGNAVADEPISWTTGADHGSPSAASSTTSIDGVAKIGWTLGLHSGTDTLAASHSTVGGEPISFTATATPNGTITGTISLSSTLQSTSGGGSAPMAHTGSTTASPRPGKLLGNAAGAPLPGASSLGQIDEPEYVPGSLIVTYRPEALGAPRMGSASMLSVRTAEKVASELRTRTAARGADLGFELKGVSPAILASRVAVESGRLEAVRAALLDDPAVLTVEREQIFYRSGTEPDAALTDRASSTFPQDPLYAPQAWHYEAIDMPEAWSHETGSSGVIVAVIDDGIRFDHPAIAANLTTDGYDFTSQGTITICGLVLDRAYDGDGPDADPTIPVDIDQSDCTTKRTGSHGLHVAGTVGAAGNDGVGVTGVNWSVSIRPIRVFGIEGSAYAWDVANGILYAAGLPVDLGDRTVQAPSAAAVINMSLGSNSSSTNIQNAVKAAAGAGSLLIAAAGNGNTSTPSYPAAYPEVLSVAAVAPSLQRASYSNYGSTIDLAAPGGEQALGADFGVASTTWDFVDGAPTYAWLQGTSMAAPHVAGVAALLLASDPGLTAADVRARLLDYAVDLGAAGRDDLYGHGLLNARNSLTQTFSPPRAVYAQLRDASSGQILQTLAADGGGGYTFAALEDGTYLVYAGEDRNGDGLIGSAGRRWATYTTTGTAAPSALTVDGAGDYGASISLGFANELEPNDGPGIANVLPVGGHFHGSLSTASEADYFVVIVPSAGTYTFETSGWDGACGYAYAEDTILSLYASDGSSLLDSNDDIDVAGRNYCSRIDATLSAGTYYLGVTGYYGTYYRVEALPPT